jgi:choline dehydrogenase-like flavoprotein
MGAVMTDHCDVIVIGSGAGGGTPAYAPAGARRSDVAVST